MQRRNSAMGLIVFSETVVPIGVLLQFWAIARGPVSLVSTIIATRPIFVFIFTLILSRVSPAFLEWHWTKAMLVLRFAAIAMIVAGVALIYLV